MLAAGSGDFFETAPVVGTQVILCGTCSPGWWSLSLSFCHWFLLGKMWLHGVRNCRGFLVSPEIWEAVLILKMREKWKMSWKYITAINTEVVEDTQATMIFILEGTHYSVLSEIILHIKDSLENITLYDYESHFLPCTSLYYRYYYTLIIYFSACLFTRLWAPQ